MLRRSNMFIAYLPQNICAPKERHVCRASHVAPDGAKIKGRRAINMLLLRTKKVRDRERVSVI